MKKLINEIKWEINYYFNYWFSILNNKIDKYIFWKRETKYYISLVGYMIFGEKAKKYEAGRIEIWSKNSHYDIDEITYYVLRKDIVEFQKYMDKYEFKYMKKDKLKKILNEANQRFNFTERNIDKIIDNLSEDYWNGRNF